jgi:predicted nuclease of predicted toxin-antitoxin system
VKLLIDMNLAPSWIEILAAQEYDAVHWSSVGAVTATDAEIMAWAATHDYVVLTHDLDFSAILAVTHGSKPSVVQIRSDNLSPVTLAGKLTTALRQMEAELLAGALLTIDAKRTRLNLLPLNVM